MKRRDFLKTAGATGVGSFMLQGVPVQGMESSKLLRLLSSEDCEDNVLVLIQLTGGNDGLHTLVPLDMYDRLQAARPGFALPENDLLPLMGQDSLALHKKMSHLQNLYSEGKVSFIQNVGYPNQNFSHFRSTDIWLTASDEDVILETGWLGRSMDYFHPDFPTNYPTEEFPDPIGVQTGVFVSPGFLGQSASYGYAIDDPDFFYQLIADTDNTPTDTPYGHELAFIRQTARQSNQYSEVIREAANNQENLSNLYPEAQENELADQMKIIARLIGGGLKTRIYMATIGGFDTHAKQIEEGDPNEGLHADLLHKVSEAMNAFQDDIQRMGIADKVLTMTFSEFGRRVASNGSRGTDHGAAAPMILMSSGIDGQVIGSNPVLPENAAWDDNIEMEIDFRSVYATVLRDWFCIPEDKIREILFGDFDLVPLTTGVRSYSPKLSQVNMFPNPAQNEVFFETDIKRLDVELFDVRGLRVSKTKLNGEAPLKKLDIQQLKTGSYTVRISYANGSRALPLVKL